MSLQCWLTVRKFEENDGRETETERDRERDRD